MVLGTIWEESQVQLLQNLEGKMSLGYEGIRIINMSNGTIVINWEEYPSRILSWDDSVKNNNISNEIGSEILLAAGLRINSLILELYVQVSFT